MKTRLLVAACLALLAAPATGALEVAQGNVKLVLYENGGRFNVFINPAGASARGFAFLSKEDPRTTMLQILVDNNIYTMGDEAGFRQAAEKTATGARFVWASALMRVTEEFVFLTAADAPLSEGVRIVIKIDNTSEADHLIGVRYLFDTYLGEKAGTHFVTSADKTFARETSFNVGRGDSYWISPFIENKSGEGLLVLDDARFVTPPSSVVFANWKRLYEANWDYKSAGNLDFNFFPYSFNDSAAAQYYPKQVVKKKTGREIVLVLGNAASYNASKAALAAEGGGISADKNKLLDQGEAPAEDTGGELGPDNARRTGVPTLTRFTGAITKPLTKSNYDLVHAELDKIDEFVAEIDAKIQAGKPLTDDELRRYRAALSEIETKASRKE